LTARYFYGKIASMDRITSDVAGDEMSPAFFQPGDMMNQLVHFENAKRELQLATNVDEVKDLRDKAEALRLYMKQAGESLWMQNQCAEIKVRAERRAGELLKVTEKHPGGNPNLSHDVTGYPPSLDEIGISRKQSSRWQAIASIPEPVFEEHVARVKDSGELTSSGLLKLSKKLRIDVPVSVGVQETCAIDDLSSLVASGKRFGCIYADPPWKYDNQATRASTDNHYSTMSVDDIAALPVKELADEQAHLHLWTTNAFLFECPKILDAWGFEYKGVFLWVKPQMGIGNYWRVSHEFLILGVRGRLGFRDHSQMSWLQAERTRHSSKPESVRGIIEKVSPGPYLELFGRKTCDGWVTWGNEIERTLFNEKAFVNECV
jgi:N6-adenosine-specific RNA methylase IME4